MDSQPTGALRPLTYGEKAVGLTFNPSNDTNVQTLKVGYAAIIDLLNNMLTPDQSEQNRWIKIAITEAQTAQMWAVKSVTYKY